MQFLPASLYVRNYKHGDVRNPQDPDGLEIGRIYFTDRLREKRTEMEHEITLSCGQEFIFTDWSV
jgi:hypothetical protein